MEFPEGLHVRSGEKRGELVIADAQDHVWVTLHNGANGDPVEWRQLIAGAVISVLEAADHNEPVCEGHPAGPFDPMGVTVYCDGSCR